MALEIEFERPYQRNEHESLQNTIIKYVRYNIKSMYPERIIHSMIDEHVKKFVPYSDECEYQSVYRSKDEYKPWGVATISHPPLKRNHNKIRKFEKDGYKFDELNKLGKKHIILLRNSIPFFIRVIYHNLILKLSITIGR